MAERDSDRTSLVSGRANGELRRGHVTSENGGRVRPRPQILRVWVLILVLILVPQALFTHTKETFPS
jgi:hypothetical protein